MGTPPKDGNVASHKREIEAATALQKTYRGHVVRKGKVFDPFLTRDRIANGPAVLHKLLPLVFHSGSSAAESSLSPSRVHAEAASPGARVLMRVNPLQPLNTWRCACRPEAHPRASPGRLLLSSLSGLLPEHTIAERNEQHAAYLVEEEARVCGALCTAYMHAWAEHAARSRGIRALVRRLTLSAQSEAYVVWQEWGLEHSRRAELLWKWLERSERTSAARGLTGLRSHAAFCQKANLVTCTRTARRLEEAWGYWGLWLSIKQLLVRHKATQRHHRKRAGFRAWRAARSTALAAAALGSSSQHFWEKSSTVNSLRAWLLLARQTRPVRIRLRHLEATRQPTQLLPLWSQRLSLSGINSLLVGLRLQHAAHKSGGLVEVLLGLLGRAKVRRKHAVRRRRERLVQLFSSKGSDSSAKELRALLEGSSSVVLEDILRLQQPEWPPALSAMVTRHKEATDAECHTHVERLLAAPLEADLPKVLPELLSGLNAAAVDHVTAVLERRMCDPKLGEGSERCQQLAAACDRHWQFKVSRGQRLTRELFGSAGVDEDAASEQLELMSKPDIGEIRSALAFLAEEAMDDWAYAAQEEDTDHKQIQRAITSLLEEGEPLQEEALQSSRLLDEQLVSTRGLGLPDGNSRTSTSKRQQSTIEHIDSCRQQVQASIQCIDRFLEQKRETSFVLALFASLDLDGDGELDALEVAVMLAKLQLCEPISEHMEHLVHELEGLPGLTSTQLQELWKSASQSEFERIFQGLNLELELSELPQGFKQATRMIGNILGADKGHPVWELASSTGKILTEEVIRSCREFNGSVSDQIYQQTLRNVGVDVSKRHLMSAAELQAWLALMFGNCGEEEFRVGISDFRRAALVTKCGGMLGDVFLETGHDVVGGLISQVETILGKKGLEWDPAHRDKWRELAEMLPKNAIEHPSTKGSLSGEVLVEWKDGQPQWGEWWKAVSEWSGIEYDHTASDLGMHMLAHSESVSQDPATLLSNLEPEVAHQIKAVANQDRDLLLREAIKTVGGLETLPTNYEAVAIKSFALLRPEPDKGVHRETLIKACLDYHPSVTREGILGTLLQAHVDGELVPYVNFYAWFALLFGECEDEEFRDGTDDFIAAIRRVIP